MQANCDDICNFFAIIKLMNAFLRLSLLLFLAFSPLALSAAEVTYTAEMKGIECAGCKKTISRALGKLPGVKTIRIVKEGQDKHRLVIVTDGTKPITRADADAALGKDSHYCIVKWN